MPGYQPPKARDDNPKPLPSVIANTIADERAWQRADGPRGNGLGTTSQMGDYVTGTRYVGNAADGIYQEQVTLLDVAGQGQGSLVHVERYDDTYGTVERYGGELVHDPSRVTEPSQAISEGDTQRDREAGQAVVHSDPDPSGEEREKQIDYSRGEAVGEVVPVFGEDWG